MSTKPEQIAEKIGHLIDRAEREERERKVLRQQREHLMGALEQLIESVIKISRSPRLREQAENAREVLAMIAQEIPR